MLPTSGEHFMSTAPLEIYLLRKMVMCSILILPAVCPDQIQIDDQKWIAFIRMFDDCIILHVCLHMQSLVSAASSQPDVQYSLRRLFVCRSYTHTHTTERQTDRQTDMLTLTHSHTHTHTHTHTQQRDRQTDRQTCLHSLTLSHTHTHTHTHTRTHSN